ncbi:MAG: hypothetical protein WC679_02270 [Bacteroidales bacterium]|jgi:hypothetical protein
MEYKQTEFFDLVDIAIRLNKQNRKDEYKHILTIKQYFVEFCSLRISVGRQVGSTSYIKAHSNKNSIIISDKLIRRCDYKQCEYAHFLSFNDFNTSLGIKLRGYSMDNIDTVYIDNAYFMSKQQIENMYEVMTICYKSKDITFVFLG